MTLGGPFFVLTLAAMGIVAWIVTTYLSAKYGVPLPGESENGQDRESDLTAARQVELLSNENVGLKRQVGRLEERIAVLERIATDPGERTAREIEQLR